jgi:hypothetical protein
MLGAQEVDVNSLAGQLTRLIMACGFGWLSACTDSPHHSVQVSGLQEEPSCSGSCDDARSRCRASCHGDTLCAADCQATWESCRLDCPDGSLASPQAPVISAHFSPPPPGSSSSVANAPTPVADAGLSGAAGSDMLNGIDLTGGAGINGINITGSGGLNGISITGVGGSGFSSGN